ncbi:hypothetical protein B0I31_106414 [Saccharothrix carnea]|uniref:DUF3592 domain-containing protein n=1 Tax=Saccharothrix carnea TaxID=1280637 RepID=A0A2P8I8V4_SACCR|nr:hypothetical protein [Saccharothrix carnea]PSL54894.1 hypothetical protein B0I31_106414 [Saccharothrix carnea]
MGGLGRFGSLCAGVVVLAVCWLAALVTLAGWMLLDAGGALLAFLGIPVVLVLLVIGAVVGTASEEGLGRTSGEGPITKALMAFFFIGCGALVVASGVLNFSGANIYHAHFGERTEAVFSSVVEFNGESGGVVKRWYYVDDRATGDNLGPLASPPPDGTEKGDPITVLVDPAGWIRPVPADSAGWTTVPTVILLGCAGVVALGALGVLATGLVVLTRRPR